MGVTCSQYGHFSQPSRLNEERSYFLCPYLNYNSSHSRGEENSEISSRNFQGKHELLSEYHSQVPNWQRGRKMGRIATEGVKNFEKHSVVVVVMFVTHASQGVRHGHNTTLRNLKWTNMDQKTYCIYLATAVFLQCQ